MRVLQLIDSLEPGGAERMSVNVANTLVEHTEMSALCCTRNEGDLKSQLDPRVDYYFADRKGKFGFTGIWTIIKYARDHQITHIHAHSSSIYIGYVLKCFLPYMFLIWHDHYGNANFIAQRPLKRYQWMSSKIDAIISVNTRLKQWADHHKLSKQIIYLQNFVRQMPDIQRDSQKQTRQKIVICLANLRPQKNHALLIKSWASIKSHYPDWKLQLIGKCFEDDYQLSLESLIKEYNLQDVVMLLGSRNDTARWLDQASIGVLSSSSEGLPLSLLEYGLAGLPVVVTDVGACNEVVGDTSMVVPPNDLKGFTQSLLHLMSDSALRTTLGQAFKNRVETEFGENKYRQSLLDLYKSMYD